MEEVIDYLINSKLFNGLSREEISFFYPHLNAHVYNISKGMILVYPDDTVDFIGVLLSGELRVSTVDHCRNAIPYRRITPFEIFAAEIACSPRQKSPFAIHSTCPSEILTFPYGLVSAKSAIPDAYRCILLKNILDILASSNIRKLNRMELLSKKTLRERVFHYLTFQAQKQGKDSFYIPLNREELAVYLCADRSALSRELSNMQKEGLIRFKKNRFELVPGIIHD